MILERLLGELRGLTKRLDSLVEEGYDLDDWRDQMAVLHALQLHSQMVIDIALRAAAILGYSPSSGSRAASILRQESVIDANGERLLRSIIGFRNIIVHGYAGIRLDLVDEVLQERKYHEALELAEKIVEGLRSRGLIDP